MRLNGTMLTETDLASFCEMRRRSYLSSQDRSITPPPTNIVPSSSLASINPDTRPPSFKWSSWSASPEEIDMAGTSSSVTVPIPSTGDPWNVDAQDTLDNLITRAEKFSDSGKSSTEHPTYNSFHFRPATLVDEPRVFFTVVDVSRGAKGLTELHGRQATQSMRIRCLS
jgi:hypothetical protein